MIFPILSDLHISNSLPYSKTLPNGETDRIKDIKKFFVRLFKTKPKLVLILGDLFDKRHLDAVTIKTGTKCVRLLAKTCPVYLLPGNHDTEDAAGNHNTMQFLSAIGSGVKVLDAGESFEIDGVTFHALPYRSPRRFVELVEETTSLMDSDARNVALIHQAINGAKQGKAPFPSEISPTIFRPFDLVLGGHVHYKQKIGNIQFVGSSYNVDFREANEVQGYHLFDTEDLSLEFMPSKMPRFRIFQTEAGKFSRDDYVLVFDPEEEPLGKARLLVSKKKEEEKERKRLDVDADRFSWEEAIAAYVKIQKVKEESTLIELGKKLLGDKTTRAGSIPGLVTFKSISARRFMSFSELDLDLEVPGVTFVSGRNMDTRAATSNGSGKSSLFRAVTWALFGKIIEDDDVRTIGAKKKTEAKLTFEKNEDTYKIERWKTKSKSGLRLSMNGEDISKEGSQKDTQAVITKLIGLDFLSFRNSVLFGQGDRMRFASPGMKDEERKKIFRSALDIDDVLQNAQKTASSYKSARQAELDKVSAEVYRFEGWVPKIEESLEALQTRRDETETKTAEKIKTLESELEELPDRSDLETKLASLVEKRKELRDDSGTLSDDVKEEKAIRKERDVLRTKLSKNVGQQEAIGGKLATIVEELERFDDGKCPTCGTNSTEGNLPVVLDKLKKSRKSVRGDHSHLKKEEKEFKAEIAARVERLDELESSIERARKSKSMADKLEGSVVSLRSKIEHLEEDEKRITNDIRELKAMVNPYVEDLKTKRQELDETNEKFTNVRLRQEKQKRAVELLDFWVQGFGNKGLAAYVVELFLPRLQKHSNKYLDILSDGDIMLLLSATKPTKKGGEMESIFVSYNIEGVEGATPSGGQEKKIEIATDLAFMDLLAERDGAEIALVWLDEILDGLDSEGRSRVMILIDELRRRKGSTFVVSHDAELSAAFDSNLFVLKKDTRSTVSLL